MKISFKKSMLVVSSLLLVFSLGACKRSPEKIQEKMTNRITEELNLTTEQQGYLTDVMDEVVTVMKESRADRKEARDQGKAWLQQEKATADDLIAIINKMHASKDAHTNSIAQKMTILQNSLTVDQKTKSVEMVEKFGKKFGKRRGRGHGGKHDRGDHHDD